MNGEILAGRYRIIDIIRRDSMFDICLAHDQVLDRKVMAKVAHEDDPIFPAENFGREARLFAQFEHPHLLPVYDMGVDGGLQFLITRFCNATLYEYLQEYGLHNLLPTVNILAIAQQLAGAIDYLHVHGPIVHGNLKPSNIVLDTQTSNQVHPYISDFAVAALGASGSGTPLYMAPEQITEDFVTVQADIYTFGVILYECFVGPVHFIDTHMLDIMEKKLTSPPGLYSIRHVRPDLPIGVDVVLDRLTRLDPAERYATATEAVEALYHAFYSGQGGLSGRVFISYARKDQDYVHKLAKQLRGIGVALWIDQDIAPGENWDQQIELALNDCDQMLLVMSPSALRSENVHDEWSYFLERGKAIYILIYEDCELPFRLRRRQYILGKGDLLADVSQIVDVLAGGNPNRSNV